MDRRAFFTSLAAAAAWWTLPALASVSGVRLPAEPTNVIELTAWFNRTFKSEMIAPAPRGWIFGLPSADPEGMTGPPEPGLLEGGLASSPQLYPTGLFPVTWKLRVEVDESDAVDQDWDAKETVRQAEKMLCGATYRYFVGLCEAHPDIVGAKLYWRRYPEIMSERSFDDSDLMIMLRMRLVIVGLDLPSMEGLEAAMRVD